MSARILKPAVLSLAVLPLFGAATRAPAQEAMMLEAIGAVRMATPMELPKRDTPRRSAGADHQARFSIPGVIGMAFSDPRIATNPAEVRRQGGFATAGAVRWLPAAPAIVEAKAEAMKLGAL